MPRLPSAVEGYSLTLYRPGHKHIGHFYLSDNNPPTESKIKHMVEGDHEVIYQRRGITVYGELEAYQQPRPVNYTATFAVIKLIVILPYGPNNTFRNVPDHPFSPRGLASDMSVALAFLPIAAF